MKKLCIGNLRKIDACILWLVLAVIAEYQIVAIVIRNDAFGPASSLPYSSGVLGFNYWDFGPIRRGLGGSITYLLGRNLEQGAEVFHFVSALFLVTLIVKLLYMRRVHVWAPLAYALIAFVLVLRWSGDLARTDMAIAALLACATLAMIRSRLVLATGFVCIGLFIHETSFIFGLPLLLAIILVQGDQGAAPHRARLVAGVLLAATLVVYVLMGLVPHPSASAMATVVHQRLPSHKQVDWAIYFTLAGMRGVQTSMCQNRGDPNYLVHVIGGMAVLLATCIALACRLRRNYLMLMLVSLAPYLFLCLIANDTSRWVSLGCFNVWLLLVATQEASVEPVRPALWRSAAALAMAFVAYPFTLSFPPVYAGSPALEKLEHKLRGAHTPSVEEALERCDPTWREVFLPPQSK